VQRALWVCRCLGATSWMARPCQHHCRHYCRCAQTRMLAQQAMLPCLALSQVSIVPGTCSCLAGWPYGIECGSCCWRGGASCTAGRAGQIGCCRHTR
jgi:hypothetical protein